MSQTFSPLDYPQVLKNVHDITNQALQVKNIGTFVSSAYDEIDLSYVPNGTNGTGNVQTVTYKLAGVTVNVLTLSYDASSNLISIVKS